MTARSADTNNWDPRGGAPANSNRDERDRAEDVAGGVEALRVLPVGGDQLGTDSRQFDPRLGWIEQFDGGAEAGDLGGERA